MDMLEKILDKLANVAVNLGGRILLALVILFIGAKFIKFILKLVKNGFERTDLEISVEQFLYSLIRVALYVILAFLVASNCGVDAASIVALLGSAGVAIGLALQGSLSNVAGGVLILLMRPFRVGDYIIEDSNKNEGTVVEISIFYTKLLTADNKLVVIPNGTLSNSSLTNATGMDRRRLDLVVGISYDANISKAKEVLYKLANQDPARLADQDALVFVDSLGDSSVNMGVRIWVNAADYWKAKWRLTENIKYVLDENGISIPYPQLDVQIKQQ